ncbi:hypothetical protein OpiT1DRAFT_04631 [Opitutaceae bacterium TAV1]|nr:hypothetical protein OpiT1DRAFT_04631 [Opitutaceae bacterium TAV1]
MRSRIRLPKGKNLRLPVVSGILGVALALLCGCGAGHDATGHKHDKHDEHGEHADGETGPGGHEAAAGAAVTFKEGRGLWLPPEVIKALDVRVAEAEERPLAAELRLTAQVYMTAPAVRASARVPAAEVAEFGQASSPVGRLVRVDRSAQAVTGFAELIFEFDPPPPPPPLAAATASGKNGAAVVGDFVNLSLTGRPATVLTVPSSAVLDGATGAFVYVVNGDAWLRTPVRTGARSSGLVEITDGLYSGDQVVASPVDQLWLTELRLTRGGGHSH